MPELPDLLLYRDHLLRRVAGERLQRVTVASPSLLKTYDPPLAAACGARIESIELTGKRIVFSLEGDLHLALHLMIAGRLRWKEGAAAAPVPRRVGLAAFRFEPGTLILTEQGSKRRAALHLLRGVPALRALDRGGIDVLAADESTFRQALLAENHTVKRALTDPRLCSGIGNAYSDEILHAARLSPLKWTTRLTKEELGRLHAATREVLTLWIERLSQQAGERFPERVTAFRPEMAVHGKYGQPCPRCATSVQRIVYADNECNYCPECQTGGKLLADRALSRLLKGDWPRSLQELDELRTPRQ